MMDIIPSLQRGQIILVKIGNHKEGIPAVFLNYNGVHLSVIHPLGGSSHQKLKRERFIEALSTILPSEETYVSKLKNIWVSYKAEKKKRKNQKRRERYNQLWNDLIVIVQNPIFKNQSDPNTSPSTENFLRLGQTLVSNWQDLIVTKDEFNQLYQLCQSLGCYLPEFKLRETLNEGWKRFEKLNSMISPNRLANCRHCLQDSILPPICEFFKENKIITPFFDHFPIKIRNSTILKQIGSSNVVQQFITQLKKTITFKKRITNFSSQINPCKQNLLQILYNLDNAPLTFIQFEDQIQNSNIFLKEQLDSIFKQKHDQFYQELKDVHDKISDIGVELHEIDEKIGLWHFSSSFDIKYNQVKNEYNFMINYLPKLVENHQVQNYTCSCGYKLNKNLDHWNKILSKLEIELLDLKNLLSEFNPANGEIINNEQIKILSALREHDGAIGRNILKLILKGSKNKAIFRYGFEKNSHYGFFSHLTISEILKKIDNTIESGYIDVKIKGKYKMPFLVITNRGHQLLKSMKMESFDKNNLQHEHLNCILDYYNMTPKKQQSDLLNLLIEKQRLDVIQSLLESSNNEELLFICNSFSEDLLEALFPVFLSFLTKSSIPLVNKQKLIEFLDKRDELIEFSSHLFHLKDPNRMFQIYDLFKVDVQQHFLELLLKRNQFNILFHFHIKSTKKNKKFIDVCLEFQGQLVHFLNDVLSFECSLNILHFFDNYPPNRRQRKILHFIAMSDRLELIKLFLIQLQDRIFSRFLNIIYSRINIELITFLYSLLFNKKCPIPKKYKISKLLTQFFTLEGLYDFFFSQGSIDNFFTLFRFLSIIQQQKMLYIILKQKHLDFLEEFSLRMSTDKLELLLDIFIDNPIKEISPLVFSFLLDVERPQKLRQKALSVLISIDLHHSEIGLDRLLTGLLHFEEGQMKQEIERYINKKRI